MVKALGSFQREDMSDLALEPLPTATERAANLIRENIFEGRFAPGMPLPEAALSSALHVSRNTVREAFRTLIGEHLLTHEARKGAVVRKLSADDVRDIYKLRRLFELSALDLAAQGHVELQTSEIGEVLAAAEQAASAGDWIEVGTANLRFHALIVDIHHSARITEVFRRLMTELRLGFLAVDDPASFHGPFLDRNRQIFDSLTTGKLRDARAELAAYLDDAEGPIVKVLET
jgi:DNA-binding GntR family transcriptional regulator